MLGSALGSLMKGPYQALKEARHDGQDHGEARN